MRSASELRDLMDTLQRKKKALENSLRANGNTNPSYFGVTQVSCHRALPQWRSSARELAASVRLARQVLCDGLSLSFPF